MSYGNKDECADAFPQPFAPTEEAPKAEAPQAEAVVEKKGADLYLPNGFTPYAKSIRHLYGDALEELVRPFPSIPLLKFPTLSRMTGGLRMHEYSILCGATGCLSGETPIRINRAKIGKTILLRDLYLRMNGIAPNRNFDSSILTYIRALKEDGRVYLHKVKAVHLSGIKETWRLNLWVGTLKFIRLTPTHRVLTRRGWVEAHQLKEGDHIALDFPYTQKSTRQKSHKLLDTYFQRAIFHPFSTHCNDDKRIVKHRAIYEANDNGLTIDEFLRIIREDKVRAKTLRYINPKTHHLHHKNHNHYDNRPENLEVLSVTDHAKVHGDGGHFNSGVLRWAKFKSFGLPGVEAVYDIECEDPYHNFAANDIIVHNSGKTTFCTNLSVDLLIQGVPHFVASIETGHTDFIKRQMSALMNEDWNTGDAIPVEKLKRFDAQYGNFFENDVVHLSLYDNRVPVEDLMHTIAWMVKHKGIKIAIVDNLNFLLEITSSRDAVIEMDRVTHSLIIFCKQVPVHIIMVMHPKKNEGGRVESEFDIKGSSTAVQEAHNVFLFNRPHPKLLEAGTAIESDRELLIAKMRRKGKYVRRRLILRSVDGVKYVEGDMV